MNFMKKIILFVFCIFTINSLYAQLKVESTGRVSIGNPILGQDYHNVLSGTVYGKRGEFKASSKLAFGDFGRQENQGWNAFVGEYGDGDSDQLWLHGKKGVIFSYGNGTAMIAKYDLVNSGFRFYTNVYANNVLLTSDERLKNDISPIKSSLNSLQKLDGVTYNLKSSLEKMVQPNFKRTTSSSEELSDKERADMAFFEEWEKEQLTKKDPRFGFIAQDLQKIFPELVRENGEGLLAIDYIGLIPIIVESIKEQQELLDAQSAKINEQERVISVLSGEAQLRVSASDQMGTGLSSLSSDNQSLALLYQNAPNPFKEKTQIRYYLPNDISSADIHIFNMQGVLIKSIPADQSGVVDIYGSDLQAGMYLYSLVVDGRLVDTKRMLLTK